MKAEAVGWCWGGGSPLAPEPTWETHRKFQASARPGPTLSSAFQISFSKATALSLAASSSPEASFLVYVRAWLPNSQAPGLRSPPEGSLLANVSGAFRLSGLARVESCYAEMWVNQTPTRTRRHCSGAGCPISSKAPAWQAAPGVASTAL